MMTEQQPRSYADIQAERRQQTRDHLLYFGEEQKVARGYYGDWTMILRRHIVTDVNDDGITLCGYRVGQFVKVAHRVQTDQYNLTKNPWSTRFCVMCHRMAGDKPEEVKAFIARTLDK